MVLNLLDPLAGLEQKDSTFDPKTATDNQLVFIKLPSGSVTTGSPVTELGHDADEIQSPGLVREFYLSTFELKQIQWRYLTDAFNEPWKSVQPRAVVGTETSVFADRMPAFGISWQALNSAVDARNLVFLTNGATHRIGIPTSAEWQYAARYKSVDKTTPYSWGTDESVVVVSEFAVVRETAGTVRGPRLVGGRKANPAGLFDMHGNVWEWTKTPDSANLTYILQGGSWNDNLLSARVANVQHQLPDVGYATAGVRLTLIP
ncbi:hypothetical protein LBMAG53_16120 [Planctomycetota bacterium]|nr:hypothetical protein LBMAG53_16120 [Planctomycetota bacterium]